MKRFWVVVAIFMVWGSPIAASYRWHTTLAEATLASAQSHKPILIYFFATWEKWCFRCEKEIYTDDKVLEGLRSFEAVKINAESTDGAQLRKQYQIYAYPSFLFKDSQGNILTKSVGFEDPLVFRQRLNLALSLASRQRDIEALAAHSASPLLYELKAILYAKKWMVNDAIQCLNKAVQLDPTNKLGRLTTAYNSLGDYYQQREEFVPAMRSFLAGSKVARTPNEKAYSYLSICACATSSGHPRLATDYAVATMNIRGVSDYDRRLASSYISQMPTNRMR
jgi:tetratricopeptide (TPR) repeat protein